jgi:hypothetical protein
MDCASPTPALIPFADKTTIPNPAVRYARHSSLWWDVHQGFKVRTLPAHRTGSELGQWSWSSGPPSRLVERQARFTPPILASHDFVLTVEALANFV